MSDDFTGQDERICEFEDMMSSTLSIFNRLKRKKKMGPLAKRSLVDFKTDEQFGVRDEKKENNSIQRSERGNQIRRMNFDEFSSLDTDSICGERSLRKRDVFRPVGRPCRRKGGLGEPE